MAVQALADGTTGDFSMNLSSVSGSVPGSWEFGILDASNSYAPYGSDWPSADVYSGLEVQQLLVTDAIYFWSSEPARTDGTFSFPNSNTGTKMFRLVESASGDVLAEYVPLTGLIRSYDYEPGDAGYGTALQGTTFVYDQALALTAAIASGNSTQAKSLVDGLLKMQTTSGTDAGGFKFSAPQLSPAYAESMYRTGAHAIAVDAVLNYIAAYPSDPDVSGYESAAESGLSFLGGLLSASGATAGLYLGGYGDDVGTPPAFDPSVNITWASTEHNIDIWEALMNASAVLGDSIVDYASEAATLESNIMSKLWNTSADHLNQGVNGGQPDTADPLDVNSWGAIQLMGAGEVTESGDAISHLSTFDVTKNGINGYLPFYSTGGYPGATPTLWFEGSFGVDLALYKTGDYSSYRTLLTDLEGGQNADGSFDYATDADTTYDIPTNEAVASTAWFVISTLGRDTLWEQCVADS